MASVEEDFPRGGPSKKSTGSKSVRQNVELDNLFQTHEPEENKKRKLIKQDGEAIAKKRKTFKETALKLNTTTIVDILHLKDLKVGTLLLGCVKEVTDFEVTVGLPSGLTGYLHIGNISDAYTKALKAQLELEDNLEEIQSFPSLLHPGMLVRCVVSSLGAPGGGHVSLKLSINPKEVNKRLSAGSLKAGMLLSGCVESIEDHGFLVDIGLSGTKAFLPKPKEKDDSAKQAELKVGQYLSCLLEEVKNDGRIIRLSVNSSAIARSYAEIQHGWTLSNLLPGLLVKAQIKEVTPHGLILEFLGSFTGTVDFMHVDEGSKYSPGDNVKARVLFVEPSTKSVGLSLRSHLLKPGGAPVQPVLSERVGEVLHDCKMTALHSLSGATLELPDKTLVFAHKNNLKETREPFNANHIRARLSHKCRIMDFSPLEQMHMVSLRMSTIKSPFLKYQDFQAGQIVEGTVTSMQSFGMLVKVTSHIKGMVPRTHLADIVLKNPEKKYSVGNKVKCRVLSVDPKQRKLVLTRKKTLLDSPLPLICSYADAQVGKVSHGYIVCAKDFGCIVRFYGNVKGLVPVSELSAEPVVVPEKLFYTGQVMKAKVLSCDADQEKLLLSFKAVLNQEREDPQKPQFVFETGKKVEARVVSKLPNGLEVSILPEETLALLPTAHLSDHTSNCGLLWGALREGDLVSNAVCLSKSKQNITLTKKPILIAALEGNLVAREFSDIQVGMQLTGWIKNIMPYGVFVEFPCALVGLAPKSAMADMFVASTEDFFKLGQTVVAKVTELDEEKRRFLVSLKVSELSAEEGDSLGRLVQGLQERKAVMEMMAIADDSEGLQFFCSLTVGQKLKLTVDEVKDDGSVSFASDQLKEGVITASKHQRADVTVTPGQRVTAAVLHVDLSACHVHVSIAPELVAKKKSLSENSTLSAKVQYVDGDFSVISLGDTSHLTIIHSTNHLNETSRLDSEKLSVGKTLSVSVKEASCDELGGLPLVSVSPSTPSHSPKASDPHGGPKGPKHAYRKGDVVTGTVKSVRPNSVLLGLGEGVTGSVHVSEVQETVNPGSFPTSTLKMGSTVTARIIGGREACSHRFLPITHPNFHFTIPELTLLPSKMKEDACLTSVRTAKQLRSYKAGEEVTCFVSKYDLQKKRLEVSVTSSINGNVELLATTLVPKEAKHPKKLFKLGQALKAKVVGLDHLRKVLCLSLTGVYRITPGVVTLGVVRKVVEHVGLIVNLPFRCSGCVTVVDLTDSYRPNPLEKYSAGQLVRCCVLEQDGYRCQLSLRPSRTNPEKKPPVKDSEVLSLDDLKEGQIVRGYVKSVGDKGVFIRLSRSIVGRAKFQHATSFFVPDHSMFAKHILPNALYTTKVLSVDQENSKVELSLLPEDTGKADVLPESLGLPLRLKGKDKENRDSAKRKRAPSESEQETPAQILKTKKKKANKKTEGKSEGTDSGVEVYFQEEEEEDEEIKTSSRRAKVTPQQPMRLQVSEGFSWDVALDALRPAVSTQRGDPSDEEEEEEEEEDKAKPQKKSRKAKELEKRQAEKQLSQLESELMDPGHRPQTASSFERLVLSSPDSSLLWLQYMAFHLQATEIEQARTVAERALKTISFREEQEKLNVWVALLNLENLYGTEESLQKVFERALQYCEPLPVYQQLADIYAKSSKHKEAEALYKSMVKRFRQERGVWLSYCTFLLKQGQNDASHALLQRALKSLPDKEHVDLIAKFAQLEFQWGDPERGKSMLDRTLTNYPKRTDLWSVYIDVMVKHGTQKEVRDLFDRVIHLSVAVKRIKFFFKRYLEYEKRHGTAESVQAVKEKALDYVEAKGPQAAS